MAFVESSGGNCSCWRSRYPPSGGHGCSQISPEMGITSTPVIDRNAGTNGPVFEVGMSLDQAGAYYQRLHALDASTRAGLAGRPAEIHAPIPATAQTAPEETWSLIPSSMQNA